MEVLALFIAGLLGALGGYLLGRRAACPVTWRNCPRCQKCS